MIDYNIIYVCLFGLLARTNQSIQDQTTTSRQKHSNWPCRASTLWQFPVWESTQNIPQLW